LDCRNPRAGCCPSAGRKLILGDIIPAAVASRSYTQQSLIVPAASQWFKHSYASIIATLRRAAAVGNSQVGSGKKGRSTSADIARRYGAVGTVRN
jgi:hypothetical protein